VARPVPGVVTGDVRVRFASLAALAAALLPARAGAQDFIDSYQRGQSAPPLAPPPPSGPVPPDIGEPALAPTVAPVEPAPEAPSAPLPPQPRFGARGQIVLSGGSSLSVLWTYYEQSSARSVDLAFAPSVDVFVLEHVSMGLSLGGAYEYERTFAPEGSTLDVTTTRLSALVRVGVALPIADRMTWWPAGSLGMESVHQEIGIVTGASAATVLLSSGPTTTQAGPLAELTAPLLFHVTPHFFVGMGPTYFHSFARAQDGPGNGGRRSSFGAGLTTGAHWGGDAPAEAADTHAPDAATPRRRRFGEARELVLSGELTAWAFRFTHDATGTGATDLAVAPALDYFFVPHLSFGVTLLARYVDESDVDVTTKIRTETERTALGGGPRVGYDVRLGENLSFYPRGAIVMGTGSYKLTGAAAQRTAIGDAWASVQVYAPLLVHVAPQAFVGFGPSLFHELGHSYAADSRYVSDRLTTLGASLTVGGWL
jgi:hypothetical protein